MNKIKDQIAVFIPALLIFVILNSCAKHDEPIKQALFPKAYKVQIDEMISETLESTNVPGVILGVWIDGVGEYCISEGTSNITTNDPMETDFHFRVGSVTKTFTGLAVLMLADEGLIDLDEPVQTYLPDKNIPRGDEITVRMLGDMTSGLYSYTYDSIFGAEFLNNPDKVWYPDSLLALAFRNENLFDPGTDFFYCNTNTIILGLLVEKISNKTIPDFLKEKILMPLELANTYWPHGSFIPPSYAHGYTVQTIDGHMADATYWNPSWAFTAGQLISTIKDLRTHIESLAKGGLISEEMLREQQQWIVIPNKGKYGFGISNKNGWLGHIGSIPGYNTAMYRHEAAGVTIVINVNSDIHQQTEPYPVVVFAQRLVAIVASDYPLISSH
ncbi:MAG: serine hydrolase domain-containing protein [Bacteroidota bacterium]